MRKPYRVLVGSLQQVDDDGNTNEYSRDDQVWLTEEEAAASGDAVEPWNDGRSERPQVVRPQGDGEAAEELKLTRELLDETSAELEAAKARIAELEAAAAPPPAESKKK